MNPFTEPSFAKKVLRRVKKGMSFEDVAKELKVSIEEIKRIDRKYSLI